MMRIDRHADDFGASCGVNANILAAWCAGGLDSVSVIANGDALHEAAAAVNADSARPLRLVVHLNLSEGYPLADCSKVPLLVNENGRFCYGFLGIWRLWALSNQQTRRRLIHQVETEWREQIRQIIDVFSPRTVVGVDGHIHIHMAPFLFPIAARLAQEFELSEIRISRENPHFSVKESLRPGFAANIVKHILLNRLAQPARRVAEISGLASPEAVAGVLYSGSMTYQTALAAAKAARQKRLNWLEIIFHPGRATPEEADRWSGQPAIAAFYTHPHRDVERDVLIGMAGKRLPATDED